MFSSQQITHFKGETRNLHFELNSCMVLISLTFSFFILFKKIKKEKKRKERVSKSFHRRTQVDLRQIQSLKSVLNPPVSLLLFSRGQYHLLPAVLLFFDWLSSHYPSCSIFIVVSFFLLKKKHKKHFCVFFLHQKIFYISLKILV